MLQVSRTPKRYIALEGNRRVAALRLLINPAVMTDLEMPAGMQKSLEALAKIFDKGKVEPISCFEMPSRDSGRYWLELRHNGENQGRGVVDWSSVAQGRFKVRDPAIQALDLVTEHGALTEDQVARIEAKFPLSTLSRLIESPDVRKRIGLSIKAGKLLTDLPASEVIKPLKRIVLDLAEKNIRVGSLMKKEQMIGYVGGFDKASSPDLSKRGPERPLESIPTSEFARGIKKRTKPRTQDPSDRKFIVPKGCSINVTDNRIAEVYKELRTLKIDDFPNAIAVLLRVFLELSVDHYLTSASISLTFTASSGKILDKTLQTKLQEVINHLVSAGSNPRDFAQIQRGLSVSHSPFNVQLLHSYLHSKFSTPSPKDLVAAWNNAQHFFERVWQ